jgi:hypothetical protein
MQKNSEPLIHLKQTKWQTQNLLDY